MAAHPKLTAKEIQEIMASCRAGESFSSIGRRLGYPHSTIVRAYRKELAWQAEERAEAEAEREWEASRDALWAGWADPFRPGGVGPIYPEPAYCLAYWDNKKNGAAPGRAYGIAMLNYNDICRNKLLPIEVAAMKTGRPLYLYPGGFPRPPKAARRAA